MPLTGAQWAHLAVSAVIWLPCRWPSVSGGSSRAEVK